MKAIKAVRVRRKFASTDENLSGLSDYKVTLYDDGGKKFKIGSLRTGGTLVFVEYKKEGRFENFSNDDFIKDGINVLISKQNDDKEFEIIQDPWLEKPPKWRSFGFTPYYLNNGSEVYIKWLEGTLVAGGRKWSDDDGNELSVSKSGDSKSFIEKSVEFFAPPSYEGQKVMKLTSEGIKSITDQTRDLIFTGNVSDKDILNLLISKWNIKIPNYNLSLCDPDYIRCEIIPYISPVDDLEDIDEKLEKPENPIKSEKLKLNVILPKDLQIRVKEDLPSFKIFVGDPPKTELLTSDEFDFGDDEDDLSLLENEFRESDFIGEGEQLLSIEQEEREKQQSKIDCDAAGISNAIINIPQGSYNVDGLQPDTPFPSGLDFSPRFNDVPIYSQYDPRWAESLYDYTNGATKKVKCGDNSTVSSSGCGPTAISMIINYWASKGYCKPTLPSAVATFFADFGGRVCGSGSGLGIVPKVRFKETFGLVLDIVLDDMKIFNALKLGYPCIISGRVYRGYNYKGEILSGKYKNGHFVCLSGIDENNRIRINDSGNNPKGGRAITSFVTTGIGGLKDINLISQRAILYPESLPPKQLA